MTRIHTYIYTQIDPPPTPHQTPQNSEGWGALGAALDAADLDRGLLAPLAHLLGVPVGEVKPSEPSVDVNLKAVPGETEAAR